MTNVDVKNRRYWRVSTEGILSWVIIEPSVMADIDKYRQYDFCRQPESCGVFLGERRGDHLVVTNISTPFPSDERTATDYKRNCNGHQEFINYYHEISSGEIQYLGEWHTHPQICASPSKKDYREWQKTMKFSSNSEKRLIFFVAGLTTDWLGVYHGAILATGDYYSIEQPA